MSKKALLDTNIFVYHYLGYPPIRHLFTRLLNDGFEIAMSSVVAMEFLSYEKVEINEEIRNKRYAYLYASTLYSVDFEVAEKAAELRRKCKIETGKTLKAGDARIAATAITKRMTLFSNNDKDFIRLTDLGLDYVNPIEDPQHLQEFLHRLL
ncbi:type II toxin-antitoxin system VapC family toxin [Geobacillus sp. BK01]|uniref:type II toxin-antitoxin system VapC family toxin n=1 Tax=Geobacillus sp. BK01 TaxID=3457328 RepID=UPI003FA5C096